MSEPRFLTFYPVSHGSPNEVTVNTADIIEVHCGHVNYTTSDEEFVAISVRKGLLVEGYTVYRGYEPHHILNAIKAELGTTEIRA